MLCLTFLRSLRVSTNEIMKKIITTVHKDRVLTVIGPRCIKADATTHGW